MNHAPTRTHAPVTATHGAFPPGPPEIPEPHRPRPGLPWGPGEPVRPLGPDVVPGAVRRVADDLDDRLLEQRMVFSRGHLDDTAAATLCARLMALAAASEAPIRLQLSAPDADPVAALAVVDTLDTLGAVVYATALGEVGGPALAVLASAERRTAAPHATLHLFEARSTADGTAEQVAAQADRHESQLTAVYERLADVTGHTVAEIRADARAGRYLTTPEAIAYGLVQPG
jgi:ATP-dependent Clp protease protease subunit